MLSNPTDIAIYNLCALVPELKGGYFYYLTPPFSLTYDRDTGTDFQPFMAARDVNVTQINGWPIGCTNHLKDF